MSQYCWLWAIDDVRKMNYCNGYMYTMCHDFDCSFDQVASIFIHCVGEF